MIVQLTDDALSRPLVSSVPRDVLSRSLLTNGALGAIVIGEQCAGRATP